MFLECLVYNQVSQLLMQELRTAIEADTLEKYVHTFYWRQNKIRPDFCVK